MARQNNANEKLWSLTFVLLIVATLLANISANGLHNGVSVLLEIAGSPASLSGFIVSCFAFTALLARFVAGYLSDNRGRKIVLYLGGLSLVAGSLLATFTVSDIMLLPSRILMGFGFSMCVTASSAAAADIIPPNRLGEGMGYQGLAVALGIALGPILAIALAYQGRFFLFAVFAVLSAFILLFTALCKLPNVAHEKPQAITAKGKRIHTVDGSQDLDIAKQKAQWAQQDAKEALADANDGTCKKDANSADNHAASQSQPSAQPADNRGIFKFVEKKSLAPAIVVAVFYMPLAIFFTFIALFATQMGIEDSTWFFVTASAVMILIRLFGSKAFDLFSTNALVVPAAVLGIAGFLVPYAFQNVPSLLFSGACYGIYMGVIQSMLTAEALRRAPKHRHGAASATFYIGCDIGVAVGAAIWGVTISQYGWGITFGLASALVAVGIILSLVLLRSDSLLRR